jgi:hypothetical protein
LRIILAFDAVAIAVADVDRKPRNLDKNGDEELLRFLTEWGKPNAPSLPLKPELDIGFEWGGRLF